METYELVLFGAGAVALVAAWLPTRLSDRPLSLPIVLVGVGAIFFLLPTGFHPSRERHAEWFERVTELGVIVSLMGAGLKLDRPLGRRTWGLTWRLLAIGMPVTIALLTVAGIAAGLTAGMALLVAACLAPTDPVLAADVQVGEPSTVQNADEPRQEDDVRFTLTSEAGLNDGLAFPFVYGALALVVSGNTFTAAGIARWLLIDVAYRIAVGVFLGLAIGRLLALAIFGRSTKSESGLAATATGFVALAATLLAYSAAELVHGYGFIAVFVAALSIRAAERAHSYINVLHDFADEFEQLLTVGLLIMFGGALVNGLLTDLDPAGAALAVGAVLFARPIAGRISFARSRLTPIERRTISFFGIRGIGSFYYLAYAATSVPLPQIGRAWSIVGAAVLTSVVVHGVAATPVMHKIDRYYAARDRRRSLTSRSDVDGRT
jgi:sodium/hydrogen antiporter